MYYLIAISLFTSVEAFLLKKNDFLKPYVTVSNLCEVVRRNII